MLKICCVELLNYLPLNLRDPQTRKIVTTLFHKIRKQITSNTDLQHDEFQTVCVTFSIFLNSDFQTRMIQISSSRSSTSASDRLKKEKNPPARTKQRTGLPFYFLEEIFSTFSTLFSTHSLKRLVLTDLLNIHQLFEKSFFIYFKSSFLENTTKSKKKKFEKRVFYSNEDLLMNLCHSFTSYIESYPETEGITFPDFLAKVVEIRRLGMSNLSTIPKFQTTADNGISGFIVSSMEFFFASLRGEEESVEITNLLKFHILRVVHSLLGKIRSRDLFIQIFPGVFTYCSKILFQFLERKKTDFFDLFLASSSSSSVENPKYKSVDCCFRILKILVLKTCKNKYFGIKDGEKEEERKDLSKIFQQIMKNKNKNRGVSSLFEDEVTHEVVKEDVFMKNIRLHCLPILQRILVQINRNIFHFSSSSNRKFLARILTQIEKGESEKETNFLLLVLKFYRSLLFQCTHLFSSSSIVPHLVEPFFVLFFSSSATEMDQEDKCGGMEDKDVVKREEWKRKVVEKYQYSSIFESRIQDLMGTLMKLKNIRSASKSSPVFSSSDQNSSTKKMKNQKKMETRFLSKMNEDEITHIFKLLNSYFNFNHFDPQSTQTFVLFSKSFIHSQLSKLVLLSMEFLRFETTDLLKLLTALSSFSESLLSSSESVSTRSMKYFFTYFKNNYNFQVVQMEEEEEVKSNVFQVLKLLETLYFFDSQTILNLLFPLLSSSSSSDYVLEILFSLSHFKPRNNRGKEGFENSKMNSYSIHPLLFPPSQMETEQKKKDSSEEKLRSKYFRVVRTCLVLDVIANLHKNHLFYRNSEDNGKVEKFKFLKLFLFPIFELLGSDSKIIVNYSLFILNKISFLHFFPLKKNRIKMSPDHTGLLTIRLMVKNSDFIFDQFLYNLQYFHLFPNTLKILCNILEFLDRSIHSREETQWRGEEMKYFLSDRFFEILNDIIDQMKTYVLPARGDNTRMVFSIFEHIISILFSSSHEEDSSFMEKKIIVMKIVDLFYHYFGYSKVGKIVKKKESRRRLENVFVKLKILKILNIIFLRKTNWKILFSKKKEKDNEENNEEEEEDRHLYPIIHKFWILFQENMKYFEENNEIFVKSFEFIDKLMDLKDTYLNQKISTDFFPFFVRFCSNNKVNVKTRSRNWKNLETGKIYFFQVMFKVWKKLVSCKEIMRSYQMTDQVLGEKERLDVLGLIRRFSSFSIFAISKFEKKKKKESDGFGFGLLKELVFGELEEQEEEIEDVKMLRNRVKEVYLAFHEISGDEMWYFESFLKKEKYEQVGLKPIFF